MYQLTSGNDNGGVDTIGILAPANASQMGSMQHVQGTVKVRPCSSSATLIASLLSHDIRHQLSVVYCNAEFLSDAAILEADRKQLFEEVKAAITDATRMLDFILFHSKRDLPVEDAVISINDLVKGAVSAIRPHPHAEGVRIDIREFPSMYGLFNQTLVSSAVYNLLLNACFAAQRTGRSGKVEVTVNQDHQFICILVKDNGAGVPIEMRQNLSKPFATWGKQNGTGLGITIADYVAREYRGNLQLESDSPGCTIFALRLAKVVLPVVEQPGRPITQTMGIHANFS